MPGTVERRRRSEIEALGGNGEIDDDEGGRRTSRRRAAKNVSRNAYIFDQDDVEFSYSPANSVKGEGSRKKEKEKEKEKRGRGGGGGRRGGRRGRRGGGGRVVKTDKLEPKVPPMKIKLIGRSGETDSPIFFAESLGEVCVVCVGVCACV